MLVVAFTVFYGICGLPVAQAYAFNELVPDVRQPANLSGGSACPVRSHHLTAPGSISVRWSTALNANPVTVITQDQTPAGRLNEIEQVISQSLAVWTGVSGTSLAPKFFQRAHGRGKFLRLRWPKFYLLRPGRRCVHARSAGFYAGDHVRPHRGTSWQRRARE